MFLRVQESAADIVASSLNLVDNSHDLDEESEDPSGEQRNNASSGFCCSLASMFEFCSQKITYPMTALILKKMMMTQLKGNLQNTASSVVKL